MAELNIDLPYEPHTGQYSVLHSKARFKVLLCGRRWGKSLISQFISIMGALEGKHIAYVTPTYQLSKVFYSEILQLLPPEAIKQSNKSDLIMRFITGGSISFLTGERLDRFRGRKFHTVIIDEAAFIPDLESAWLNAIRPTLTDYQGNAIFISTPRGKNYFYTLYLKGMNGDDNFQSWHYSTYDNPNILTSEIESAKASLPYAAFQQEYLAVPQANQNGAVSSEFIEAGTIEHLSTKEPVVFGIDIAKYRDWTVICGLDEDGAMCHFERFQRDNEMTKQRIKQLPAHVLKVVDSTHGSIGDGIYESLQREGVNNLMGFEFTSSSKPKLITEMILAIEQGQVKFNEATAKELSVFEYAYSTKKSGGYISYQAASGAHDDTVVALAMALRGLRSVPRNGSFTKSFGFFYDSDTYKRY